MHANQRHRAAVRLAGRRPLGINPALQAWHAHKKPRVETRGHDAREPAASCRGSLGGPPPAWNQPGPPGLARTQEAPGGNPGTPGMKTTPPSMPDDGTQCPGSNPHRMAPGKACDPVSPGFRRGLFVGAPGPEGRVDCTRAEARQANCGTRPQVRVKHPPRLPPGAFCGSARPGGPGCLHAGSGPPSELRHEAAGSRETSSPASAGGFLWERQARRAGLSARGRRPAKRTAARGRRFA